MNHPFSEAARRRGLIALLIDVFCMYTGFFMVVPLISVPYVDGLGWAAASIGLVLGVRQVTQQRLTLFGGVLADQIGAKWLICMGLAVRIVGFGAGAAATLSEQRARRRFTRCQLDGMIAVGLGDGRWGNTFQIGAA